MSRVSWATVALLVVSAVLSGCLGGSGEKGSPVAPAPQILPWLHDYFPFDLDHDHADASLHNESLNVEFVAFHDCTPTGSEPGARHGFSDIKEWGDYVFVGQGNGFCILDVKDPYHPAFVSHFEAQGSSDIDVSDDGNWVFHATQRNPVMSAVPGEGDAPWEHFVRGLLVVDVSNKMNPTFESYYPVPTNGVHTVHYHKHQNGDRLVLIQSYDWMPPSELGVNAPLPRNNAPATQRVEITKMVERAGTTVLERVAIFQVPRPAATPFVEWFPHDCTVQKHPFTNQTLMYCAYWDAGMTIVDITSPGDPKVVSSYDQKAPSAYNQYHYVLPVDGLIDGRHITVAAPEIQVAPEEPGYIRVFDTTDPTKPTQIGAWTLPGKPGIPGGFLYSPHQFDVAAGRIIMGHNHAGTWIIDISNATNLAQPVSAGFFVPRGDEKATAPTPALGRVWVAVEHRGFIYSVDTALGVHVHRDLGALSA